MEEHLEEHLNPDGHNHLFQSGVNMALILETNPNSDVYKTIIERRDLFDLKGVPDQHPHLTLHMINFNLKHTLINKVFLKKIKGFTKKCYIEILRGYKLIKEDFELLGKETDPTFVMKYKLNYPDRITKFRLCLYDEIARLLDLKDHKDFKKGLVRKINNKKINNKKMFVYSTPDGIPVYGIQDIYHGRNNWLPHISLFKLKEKLLSTEKEIGYSLFNVSDYSKIDQKDKKILSKVTPFRGVPHLSFEDLILKENHFGKIKVSMIGSIKDIEYTGAKKKRGKSRSRKKRRRGKSRSRKKSRRGKSRSRKKSRRKI
jgi:hypothetical protein